MSRTRRMRAPLAARLALGVVAALLLAATALSGYARYELVDTPAFSARVASALDNEDVRGLLARRVVDGLAAGPVSDVLVVRPLLTAGVAHVAGTPVFKRIVEHAIADQHRALFKSHSTVSLNLEYAGTTLVRTIRAISPRAARFIPLDVEPQLVALKQGDIRLTIAHALTTFSNLWWILLAASALVLVACAALASGLRDAIVALGASVTAGGLLIALLVTEFGSFLVARFTDGEDPQAQGAVHALWGALMGDLRTTGLIAAFGAAAVAVVASTGFGTEWLERAWRRVGGVAVSGRPVVRAAFSAALIALGAALVLYPHSVGLGVDVVLGAAFVFVGLARLSSMVRGSSAGEPVESGAAEPAAGEPAEAGEPAVAGQPVAAGQLAAPAAFPSPTRARPLAFAATVGVLLAATAAAVAFVLPAPHVPPANAAAAAPKGGCNGSVALCSRRLDEVVFPTTHNSYAASDEPGWLFANQRYGIKRQLDDGIRGLTLDIHFGERDPSNGRVRTDLRAEGSDRNKVVQQLGPRAVGVAERVAGGIGLGHTTGNPQPYLCHTLCELGSEPLDQQLDIVKRFLDTHRNDVLILFVEPYVPVATIEQTFEKTGLLSQAAELQRDEPLPTLGQLVKANTRLVVFAEKDGGARPWYLPGFSFVQDTPYDAKSASEISCRANRGTPDSPMFLVNHWVASFPPSPSRNEAVGGAFLRRSLTTCQRERGMLPNLVAVDFYERSGVIGIARSLNDRP